MVTTVLSKLYSSGKQRFFVYFASQLVNDGLFPFKRGDTLQLEIDKKTHNRIIITKANNSKLKPLRNNKGKKKK
jgi:hypothetical protein